MGKKKKILIVEDEAGTLRVLQLRLKLAGYEVKVASSGELGVEVSRSFVPELVLSDVVLPGMDGFRMVQALRAQEETKDVHVFFMSAFSIDKNDFRVQQCRAITLLEKPFPFGELQQELETLFGTQAEEGDTAE